MKSIIKSIKAGLAILILCAGCTRQSQQSSLAGKPDAGGGEGQPNIILFVADDHGTDALGCYGNSIILDFGRMLLKAFQILGLR